MLAMLALTAVRICGGGSNRGSGARLLSPTPHHAATPSIQVHDIMKVEALLPKVDAKHGPYEGFKEGVVINDHDVALGYVT